jgi:hypothetical protein
MAAHPPPGCAAPHPAAGTASESRDGRRSLDRYRDRREWTVHGRPAQLGLEHRRDRGRPRPAVVGAAAPRSYACVGLVRPVRDRTLTGSGRGLRT